MASKLRGLGVSQDVVKRLKAVLATGERDIGSEEYGGYYDEEVNLKAAEDAIVAAQSMNGTRLSLARRGLDSANVAKLLGCFSGSAARVEGAVACHARTLDAAKEYWHYRILRLLTTTL